jgi:ribosomal protein S3
MGQKINANALRLGINKTWKSSWFSGSKEIYTKNLHEDLAIRKM